MKSSLTAKGDNLFVDALLECGLGFGDNVYIHSQLFTLAGIFEVSGRSDLLQGLYFSIRKVIGDNANIAVPTFTMSLGRSQQPFIQSKTPSETGMFSEFIPCLKGI